MKCFLMNDRESTQRPLAAIILAAGKGTRMGDDRPKVLHEVAGEPMVRWVVNAARASGVSRIILVVGHGADDVCAAFQDDDIEFVLQEEQLGTGHAVKVCREAMDSFDGNAYVLAGDGPLIRRETLAQMLAVHEDCNAAATLATSIIDDPTGYGRIIRNAEGRFESIIEHRNATDEQLMIHEIYPSYALFDSQALFCSLETLEPNPVSGEFYLTEIPEQLLRTGGSVEVVAAVPPEDVLSINTPDQLAEVDAILRSRLETSLTETTS